MKKKLVSFVVMAIAFTATFAKSVPSPDEGMWLPMFFKQLNYSTMQKMGLRLTAEELYDFNHSSVKEIGRASCRERV